MDFREVKLAHKTWKYSTFSLTPAASALISLAVTLATWGIGSTISGAVTAALSTTTTTATGATVVTSSLGAKIAGTMASAGFRSLVSSATVTLANNKGNLKKTLKDMGKTQFVRGIATAMVVAGATYGISDALGVSTEPAVETVQKGSEVGETITSTAPTLLKR